MFKIAKLQPEQRDYWAAVLTRADERGESVRIAFDDLDQAIKLKIGEGPWSPPFPTEDAD